MNKRRRVAEVKHRHKLKIREAKQKTQEAAAPAEAPKTSKK